MRRAATRSPPLEHPSAAAAAMDPSKRAPPPHFSLLSRIAAAPSDTKRARGGLWISIAALFAAAWIFLGLLSDGGKGFGIVIDGGSTGTRIHVFAYVPRRGAVPVIDLGSTATMKVGPGLSSYAGTPEAAGESLMELLEFARRCIPREMWEATEVRLMATAGLRLLDVGLQERILESCRRVLRNSGFPFLDEWVKVITGSDEGIYAWVTANYALGTLGSDRQHTTGVIELGGASAQVTFVSSEPVPPEYSHELKFGKVTYNLYSHSFLHFGQNSAYESTRMLLSSGDLRSSGDSTQEGVVLDPCSPKGYVHPVHPERISVDVADLNKGYDLSMHTAGNFSQCRTIALMLLQKEKDKCSFKHCNIGSVYVPKLQGNFLATENFFYTSKFFGLSSTAGLSDMVNAGEQYCSTDWAKLRERYPAVLEENLLQYCFSSAYIVALLHDGLGIALDEKSVKFASHVGSISLDWAMGAFLMQRMSADSEAQPSSDWITNITNNDALASVAILGMFLVLVIGACSASKWSKPKFKTIYDLERGRYIITRLSP